MTTKSKSKPRTNAPDAPNPLVSLALRLDRKVLAIVEANSTKSGRSRSNYASVLIEDALAVIAALDSADVVEVRLTKLARLEVVK